LGRRRFPLVSPPLFSKIAVAFDPLVWPVLMLASFQSLGVLCLFFSVPEVGLLPFKALSVEGIILFCLYRFEIDPLPARRLLLSGRPVLLFWPPPDVVDQGGEFCGARGT